MLTESCEAQGTDLASRSLASGVVIHGLSGYLNPCDLLLPAPLEVTLTLMRPWALALARRKSRSQHEAEDVVQDAYICAWVRFNACVPPSSLLLGGWLSVTMHRLAGRQARKRAAEEMTLSLEEELRAQPVLSPDSDLVDYLLNVPPREAEVLRLHYGQGLTCTEVCVILRVPVGTVRSRLNRGLVCLRRKLRATATSHR